MAGYEGKSNRTKDERNFFRVEDEIYLEFRVLTEPVYDKTRLPLARKDNPAGDVLADLTVVNAQIHPLLETIKHTDTAIARCLEALSKKIDLVAKAVSKSGEAFRPTKPNRKVNLSAGGVAFNVATQLLPGTPLEVRMAVVATNLVITCYGEVTYCERDGKDLDQPYRVGIKFPALTVADRQALFAHVLGRHTEKIRGAKLTGDEKHSPPEAAKK
jgi:hypothetical protein